MSDRHDKRRSRAKAAQMDPTGSKAAGHLDASAEDIAGRARTATVADAGTLVWLDFRAGTVPLDSAVHPTAWKDQALCAQTDPEAFFPEKGGSTREAKKVCRSCEVRAECLEYALDNDERFGIWGGMSERERRRLKREVA